ncbi:30S ribosomal protein S6 [Magnaporthiopsis poae ATCC 64411]|uniref:30S ribosomal protein S6 n=1 Tax=Magnaporthiopsis poae (strain ATCC 64411 / 73-15) TaxID=644358 RepID=A0A0C4EFW9_MAGP6|nr:30S ribosomal protein S6 [Magnaporthiopsis poae ATCC 64411]
MLYELIGIIRPGRPQEVKEIVLTAGQTILRGGGVIRDIANWGVFMLPRSATRSQIRHHEGHYFVMRYDAGVAAQRTLREALRLELYATRTVTQGLAPGQSSIGHSDL